MASSRPSTSRGVTGVSTRKKTLDPSEISKLLGTESDSDSDPGSDNETDNLDSLYANGEAANYSSSDSDTEVEIEPKRLISKSKPGKIYMLKILFQHIPNDIVAAPLQAIQLVAAAPKVSS